MSLEIRSLSNRTLQNVSLSVASGEVLGILGPSGSGKSSLLYLIAGLEAPSGGEIHWNGENLAGKPLHQRGIGLVFQDYALFPHLNAGENIAYGLRWQKLSPAERKARVEELLELVALEGYATRKIATLSGGEQQRVALARSLAPRPQLLLLDEPLSALDRALRDALLPRLANWLHEHAITAISVTHDPAEAFALADKVAILRAGRIVQMDTPQQLYQQPVSPFVAHFLGQRNLFPGVVEAGGVRLGFGWLALPKGELLPSDGTPVTALLRPHKLAITPDGQYQLTITQSSFQGSHQTILGKLADGSPLQLQISSNLVLPPATVVKLEIPPNALLIWQADENL